MIVASLLLIVTAVALLVAGLVQGANAVLVGSIAASLLAAVALIVSGRQDVARVTRAVEGRSPSEHEDLSLGLSARGEDARRARRAERQPVGASARTGGGGLADDTTLISPIRDEEPVMSQQSSDDRVTSGELLSEHTAGDIDYDDDEPEDEPPVQPTSAADMARVAALSTEVLVIDGRPRYHLRGCEHLLDRESEPLPASEAVELGFTPCSVCEPNSALLAR